MQTRWATAEDFALLPPRRGATTRGLVLLIDGRPAAIATLRRVGMDTVQTGFLDYFDRAAIRPLTLHRFGKAMIEAAVNLGVRRFLTCADSGISGSDAWLQRLGFKLLGHVEGGGVYLYER